MGPFERQVESAVAKDLPPGLPRDAVVVRRLSRPYPVIGWVKASGTRPAIWTATPLNSPPPRPKPTFGTMDAASNYLRTEFPNG